MFFFSQELELSDAAIQIGKANNFDVKGYSFEAKSEDLRSPRIVRVGAIQNTIAVATTEPIHVQRDAIYAKVSKMIKAAALCNVNVLCLQEAWSKFTYKIKIKKKN